MKTARAAIYCWAVLFAACRPEVQVTQSGLIQGDRGEDVEQRSSHDEWEAALEPRALEFPRDHSAHTDYRIEWWYYTGNLESQDGRRFGYQLTFFRTGVQRESNNPSRWAVRDLYTAHFAISDVAEQRFLRYERTHRGGVDWAGANRQGSVWNGDWTLKFEAPGDRQTLYAASEGNSIRLSLTPAKPLVLHGQAGLSRKGATPGNASYYYSFPRLHTTGELKLGDKTFEVHGESWMDHEFSSSFLEKGQQGWDWFSIQLDSGEELMLYQMRLRDGSADPHSSGTWIAADGTTTVLSRDDFFLEPHGKWRSPTTAAVYPTEWRVRVASLDLNVVVTALMPNQEMDTSASTGIIYWEGCVDVAGRRADSDVRGRGYLEMTGYTGRGLGEMLN